MPDQTADAEPVNMDIKKSANSSKAWKRGFFMVVFAIFFGFAQTLLFLAAIVQFLSLLITGKHIETVADFGKGFAVWLSDVGRFQTGASEAMPFPWAKWGACADKGA